MKMLNLVKNIMRCIMMVSLSLLLTLMRFALLLVAYPLVKLLEITNNLYMTAMEETHEILSL